MEKIHVYIFQVWVWCSLKRVCERDGVSHITRVPDGRQLLYYCSYRFSIFSCRSFFQDFQKERNKVLVFHKVHPLSFYLCWLTASLNFFLCIPYVFAPTKWSLFCRSTLYIVKMSLLSSNFVYSEDSANRVEFYWLWFSPDKSDVLSRICSTDFKGHWWLS